MALCHKKENIYGIIPGEKNIKLNVLGFPIKRKNGIHGNDVCIRMVFLSFIFQAFRNI